MRGNESTDFKNSEENALKNAIKYLEVAGFKKIVILASTDNMYVIQSEWGGLRRKIVHPQGGE